MKIVACVQRDRVRTVLGAKLLVGERYKNSLLLAKWGRANAF
jgi:hypothetical protein